MGIGISAPADPCTVRGIARSEQYCELDTSESMHGYKTVLALLAWMRAIYSTVLADMYCRLDNK